ncbi:hypothetical protein [Cohnella sp. JJ-181]|uniref:hypothetical protein n=1 Tax=Cohnella rhizoplanae TaxID=2974897 RepID=UPI0022FFBF3A|nr:hypothetical protein [Cohnella sp. JJ-181]CAI6084929.1 hypothetical protein COHCIP112018_04498 [Cohnella sp. JJ-181]
MNKFTLEVIHVIEIKTAEELIQRLTNMNKQNSICQILLPGKGTFTIVLQEENEHSGAENKGRVMPVSELERNPFL